MPQTNARVRVAPHAIASMLTFIVALILCALALANPQFAYANEKTVSRPTQEEITAYFEDAGLADTGDVSYSAQPSAVAPYKLGALSDKTENDALKMLNWVRFIAGIPSNVTLNKSYSELAQGAALGCAANNKLTHFPAQPSGMSDELYELCAEGGASTNIAWNYGSPANAVLGFMDDSDWSNIDAVGHRRWCINPAMAQTGFGQVGAYSAMYSFDGQNEEGYDYEAVLWPAATMPVELFYADEAWSVSTQLADFGENITVTLKRLGDGKTWFFSGERADGDYYLNNDPYSSYDAIIFRPNNLNDIADGDSFQVTVAGSLQTKTYPVNFFQMLEDEEETYGTWVRDGSRWWFAYDDGGYATGWCEIDGAWYHFDHDGWMQTGWLKDGKNWYYLTKSGAMQTGWLKDGKSWYYLQQSGAMATGWCKVGTTWYYLDGTGAMQTGWKKLGAHWYYLKNSGAMATGWQKVGHQWYYLYSSGAMATGWVKDGGAWYYLQGSGAMAHNQWIGNYYMGGNGAMATSSWIGTYWVNADGLWTATR